MLSYLPLQLFLLFYAVESVLSHRCSYVPPEIDEVVTGVYLKESPGGRKRSTTQMDNLRISFYFDRSLDELPPETLKFVEQELLPHAKNFWQAALMIRPLNGPILLNRKCQSNQYYADATRRTQSCAGPCKNTTKCGEVIVPDHHLFQCQYCSDANANTCQRSGPPDGNGIAGADYLLYVSAVHSERCKSRDTVAYAAHCQQEAELDRPIAGHVNICPKAISVNRHDREVLFSTVKHEILHALGFSAGLFAFFRDAEGKPLTERSEHGRPLEMEAEGKYFKWSDKTIRKIPRKDWWAHGGSIEHQVNVMVTPKVQAEARKHFNCATLEGAEVENQGSDGTAFTHWEKRLFENEAMTGTHTQNPVYSRLTLALMEDTGWYAANYSMAEPLHWGSNLGCDFATKSCGEWIHLKRDAGQSPAPFCDVVKGSSLRTSTTTCTDGRDSVALCNLVEYNDSLPIAFQNFRRIDSIDYSVLPRYGGSVELADFCPYNQEFEWKYDKEDPKSKRRDSRCELEFNTPEGLANVALESYGDESRCFLHKEVWTQQKCGYKRTLKQYGAGCYEYSCLDQRLHIRIFNESGPGYPCYEAGQSVKVRRIRGGYLHEGSIICPRCDEFCVNCRSDEKPPGFIGDPKLAEPCGSCRTAGVVSLALLATVILALQQLFY